MAYRWLLGSVIVLGLMHGIAFSASYQMVARFANKNTISLGLGCVGSGLLALALEVVLEVGPKPTRTSFIILFEVAAGEILYPLQTIDQLEIWLTCNCCCCTIGSVSLVRQCDAAQQCLS